MTDSAQPSWKDYFDCQEFIEIDGASICLYSRGFHAAQEQDVLIAHHGAGFSALTFALLSKELEILNPRMAFICFDARDHGTRYT